MRDNAKRRGSQNRAGRVFSKIGKIIGTVFLTGLITCLILACIFAVYVKSFLQPQLNFDIDSFSLDQTSVIYYKDNKTGEYVELQKLYGTENRIWAAYSEIPRNIVFAAVAIEDKRFFEHNGVDWYRTAAASVNMFLGMRSDFGASTITQQLIKNVSQEDEVTVRRKLTEIFRALEFEKKYSKEEILEWYLNTIYLGESAYGVKSAANVYFGKDLSQLSVAECASLIGITNNPSIYDPYISVEKNKKRQELILDQMLAQGYITQSEHDEAVAEELVFVRGSGGGGTSSTVYSYFVDQVIRDVVADLVELTGYSSTIVNRMVTSGGYSIYATIDVDVQEALESVYTDISNIPETVGTFQQLQSGMTIIDNASGDIVAMVGGVGEKEGSLTLNRATQSLRSPGSAIKPISVYAPALELGKITPATVYDDTPLSFEGGLWPKNYDNTYRGLMTINRAMELSTNTVAAKLVTEMTPEVCFNFAQTKMGLKHLVAAKEVGGNVFSDINVAPMALGGLTNGVTIREITEAYAAFDNDGVYRKARTYTEVRDSDGKVILENSRDSNVAMKPLTAYYITEMLENVVQNGTGRGAALENMPVAGKTGTTTSDYDRWFCGYTPYYTASVWVGYDQQEEIQLADSSINPATALWKKVMEKVHKNLEYRDFDQPSSVVAASYCADSGLLATPWCQQDIRGSRVITGKLALEDVPTNYCSIHVSETICDVSGQLATSNCSEGTKTVGMLNVLRQFPVSGVVVGDQQYTVGFLEGTVAKGFYPALAAEDDPINSYCSVHTAQSEVIEEEPAVPEAVEEPVAPVESGQVSGEGEVVPESAPPEQSAPITEAPVSVPQDEPVNID